MNVSLISMKNVIFLLVNPPSKWSKSQTFSRLRRARWSLIILRNPESEIKMYRLLAFRKSAQMPMYRLLRGAFIVNCLVVIYNRCDPLVTMEELSYTTKSQSLFSVQQYQTEWSVGL